MSGRTSHYGWSTLQQGDSLSDDGYKYPFADRVDMDRRVFLGAEGHHHLGGVATGHSAPNAPTLSRVSSGGLIPANTRVYYKIALVSTTGEETAASAESFIDTPAAIAEPSGPSAVYVSTGGALLGGTYYYALSAYQTISTTETRALGTVTIAVTSATGTNKITLTLPSLPAGATGFNLYRRAPGESKYYYLASTAAATYVDNGAVAENCDRTVPATNTTQASSSIIVTYPGATPVVPAGYTWKIYRTYVAGDYTNSFLVSVVEHTAEASPIVTTFYTDQGIATSAGTPLSSVVTVTNPDQILLTDAAEVQGTLPPANIVFQRVVEFAEPGTLHTKVGTFVWRCPYVQAKIEYVVINLGRGSAPVSSSVIVDVNKYSGSQATPTNVTIFTTQGNRPKILTGHRVSTEAIPDITSLLKGDELTIDIDQVGGGATPTDFDLLVSIVMWYRNTTATTVVFS